ncbi:MAG: anhydro-N-acetylmuramic acid kinase [Campylobacterales bacterium]|nr:anhydro-N-acetylmuramic acid kinase [Campylobacterales bacterium]
MSEKYIGVMSGTSLDGIDVVLCEINSKSCRLLFSSEYPFDKKLKEDVLHAINAPITLEYIGHLDTRLGELFADAINSFLEENNISPEEVTAIGLHGQTLWHQPNGDFPFSMQLGNPNILTTKTGISVVSDFRRKDIANGGQGAPFAPAFHKEIFGSIGRNTAVVNIGGMANITFLNGELRGYDTGVGNVLMDYWIQQNKNLSFDKDGKFAACGRVNEELLKSFLSDDYFQKLPPKSTGREYFNATWLSSHLPTFQTIKDEDIQRTLLELTAQSIANEILNTPTDLLIICGGGAKNSFLMQRLQKLCKIKVAKSNDFGISSNFLEAMAFAWLAYKRVHNEEVMLSSVTGAKKDSILGGVYV